MSDLIQTIIQRRTSKPVTFSSQVPNPSVVRQAIEISRNAPNHHRTEPARFYLLDSTRIKEVGRLYGEIVVGNNPNQHLIERGAKKAKEWGN